MTEREIPEQLAELMAGYVFGNLTPEEAEALQQQLTEHPELYREIDDLQEALELLPYALPTVEPPPGLRSTLLKNIEHPELRQQPSVSRIKNRLMIGSGILGGVAALLALAMGLDNYYLRQQITTIQAQVARQKELIVMLQQPNTRLVSLKGMDQASTASGSIVVTPGEPKVVLILQNLPVLPQGKFYQLWSVVNNQKIPWEKFAANEQGRVFVKLDLPSDSTQLKTLAITIETSPAPKNPTGPMIMTSQL
ncbi:MAG: anti-sigma factor [Coleofasciculaceae cyanobacterium]